MKNQKKSERELVNENQIQMLLKIKVNFKGRRDTTFGELNITFGELILIFSVSSSPKIPDPNIPDETGIQRADGKMYTPGNRTLYSLNLAYNKVSSLK